MKFTVIVSMVLLANVSADTFPELPTEGPIPKTVAWEILEKQWKMIEPILFTEKGSKHLGRSVRFQSTFVSLRGHLEVRSPQGTRAVVKNVPQVDLDLLKSLRDPAAQIVVEGTLVAIDVKVKTITVKAGGIRPSQSKSGEPKVDIQPATAVDLKDDESPDSESRLSCQ